MADLVQVVTQAVSNDAVVVKNAEAQLKEMETKPGFYSALMVNMRSIK